MTTTTTENALIDSIMAVDLATVPVFSLDRCAPRKEQAALARQLFRQLGLRGLSVTAPRYSMAQSVDVQLPSSRDCWEIVGHDVQTCLACQSRHEARERLREILDIAFPNHTDRSEYGTDYYNYRWSIS